jgi:hypothetical protein
LIVTSFFTPNGRYPELAATLRTSCERVGLKHRIVEMKDGGDWLSNNNLKPQIILSTLMDTREPVLWCDCDCEILRMPNVSEHAEFGSYNWSADPLRINQEIPYDPRTLTCSGGVLYFNYTAPAMELLIRWCDAMNVAPQSVDDQTLSKVYNFYKIPLRVQWFDKKMNWMNGELFGPAPDDCVILHRFVNRKHWAPVCPSHPAPGSERAVPDWGRTG